MSDTVSPALDTALTTARRALLDLSTRNRLLSLPRPGRSAGVIALTDEDPDFVVTMLTGGKSFTFEAAEGDATETTRTDTRLRAALGTADLPKKLLALARDTRTMLEESGVNTLSLGCGALVWFDPGTPKVERRAPLALMRVALERGSVRAGFRLSTVDAELEDNLCLRQKLQADFGITLPDFPGDATPGAWAETVKQAIAAQPGWRVEPDALHLGLFSFAKFLMYADLDPAKNPTLTTHGLVRALLTGQQLPPADIPGDDTDIDALIPVEKLDFAVDADASQTLAAHVARIGSHLVIQGPPGTGKSQVITNIISQAVLDGRRVLFMAEKLAALQVVKRRLDAVGIGAACLELHSDKLSKRAVLDELRATLSMPAAPKPARDDLITRLGSLRSRLNKHAAAMTAPIGKSGRNAYHVTGQLVRLRANGMKAPRFTLDGAAAWTSAQLDERRRTVRELAARCADLGQPDASPWAGITADLPAPDLERALQNLPEAIRALTQASACGLPDLNTLRTYAALAHAPAEARTLAACAEAAASVRADQRFTDKLFTADGVQEARDILAEDGGLLGFVSPARRKATALLADICRGAPPEDTAARTAFLDAALAARRAADAFTAAQERGRALFGSAWPTGAAAHIAWLDAHPGAATIIDGAERAATFLRDSFGREIGAVPFAQLGARLTAMAAAPQTGFAYWAAWQRAAAAAQALDLQPLVTALADGSLAPEEAMAAHVYAEAEALLKCAMRQRPELASFDGPAHLRLVDDFRDADVARMKLTQAEAAWAHAQRVTRARTAPGADVLRGEMERKRGFTPVRDLLARAAPAVQLAKPVFMMSPLSVAQFLKPGVLEFDMLVMDEASQVEPVDALGAIARCKQIVIVGDDKQMPPTRFFQRMTGDDDTTPDADDSGVVQADDVESILGLCNARGVPSAMLRWHYRSRHESLIATSNREFYDNRLLLIPSPRPRSADLGLSLVRVDGRFDTGATGTNKEEAKTIAEAVIRHAKERPQESLGVAAFSVSQRDAITDAVEALRKDSPDLDAFFNANPQEPFFIKNLENVQGDERDVMFISVGYGRSPDGKLAMRFGPLSADGGERRLNVLITRAKKRCVVFSSIGADDIDLNRAGGRGVAALKTFLAFAAAPDTAYTPAADAAETAPLETSIADVLSAESLNAVPRVGTSGLFLDLAVSRADAPGDFVLGIETDGPAMAASRSARDRDRQRDNALRMMGWTLHRTLAMDWLNTPDAAAARLRKALGLAAQAAEAAPQSEDRTGLATPYVEAAFDVPKDTPPAQVPFAKLAGILARIVGIEGPVHQDAIVERVRILWNLPEADAKLRAAAQQALRLAKDLNGLVQDGLFWRAEDAGPATPRDRRAAAPLLRQAAMLPPDEVQAAIVTLLDTTTGATADEIAAGVTRMLGADDDARAAVIAQIALLQGAGKIREAAPGLLGKA